MHLLFARIRGYVGHSVYLTKFGSRYAVWTQSRSAEVKYLTVFPKSVIDGRESISGKSSK